MGKLRRAILPQRCIAYSGFQINILRQKKLSSTVKLYGRSNMGFKEQSYLVEAIDVQGKVASKETFMSRTGAETFGRIELRNRKIKCIKINGKLWKVKNQ